MSRCLRTRSRPRGNISCTWAIVSEKKPAWMTADAEIASDQFCVVFPSGNRRRGFGRQPPGVRRAPGGGGWRAGHGQRGRGRHAVPRGFRPGERRALGMELRRHLAHRPGHGRPRAVRLPLPAPQGRWLDQRQMEVGRVGWSRHAVADGRSHPVGGRRAGPGQWRDGRQKTASASPRASTTTSAKVARSTCAPPSCRKAGASCCRVSGCGCSSIPRWIN